MPSRPLQWYEAEALACILHALPGLCHRLVMSCTGLTTGARGWRIMGDELLKSEPDRDSNQLHTNWHTLATLSRCVPGGDGTASEKCSSLMLPQVTHLGHGRKQRGP